jgi:multidrug efflux pump
MAFLTGITGQFYKQFAVTIAISTVISAINSLTLSPALAAKLLQGHGTRKDWFAQAMDRSLGWFFRPFNRFFQRSSVAYQGTVGQSFHMRGIVFLVYAVLIGSIFFLFNRVPGGFIPTQDKLYLFAGAKLPEGASLARTDAVLKQMVHAAHQVEGVDMLPAMSGYNALQVTNTPNLATSYIRLTGFEERHKSAQQIVGEINQKYSQIPGAITFALLPPPIQGLGNGSGYSLYIEDRAGLGYGALQNAVSAFQATVAQTPGMTFPVSSYQSNIRQLEVQVDREKAKAQGISLTEVFDTLQTYLGSVYVNDFNTFGRVYRVMVQADSQHRQRPEDITNLRVRNGGGEMVPIGSVATITQSFGPDP